MTTSDYANSVILLVDDKPDNLDILIHQLEDIGHGLCVALSGEEALRLATEQLPSMILLDIMMPGINGFETCVELKNNPATRDIPVIFMSALSGTDSKIKGFSVGGVDFITKPFQREEVIARINTHLTIRRQRLLLQAQNIALEDVNNQFQAQISQTQQAQTALSIADNKLSALT
jgi:DNA-binding response OmpR family regulator